MNNFIEINTVLGQKKIERKTAVLSHEHICCYSEYLDKMSANYLNRDELIEKSTDVLKKMHEKYNLGLFVDCTPLNIGRNIDILKQVSRLSGVDIVCSTGFYYGDEPILNCMSAETIADCISEDAAAVSAGVIKAAVEYDTVSDFNVKLLKATAIAQKKTGLPIILHTNANNKNGIKATEILLGENVSPQKITVGHLSDTGNSEYIESIARLGCFVAFDRLYDDKSEEYINAKVRQINTLCDAGYENQILLSHDDAVFQGFCDKPCIKNPRWDYMFEYILPMLDTDLARKLTEENPIAMLCGR